MYHNAQPHRLIMINHLPPRTSQPPRMNPIHRSARQARYSHQPPSPGATPGLSPIGEKRMMQSQKLHKILQPKELRKPTIRLLQLRRWMNLTKVSSPPPTTTRAVCRHCQKRLRIRRCRPLAWHRPCMAPGPKIASAPTASVALVPPMSAERTTTAVGQGCLKAVEMTWTLRLSRLTHSWIICTIRYFEDESYKVHTTDQLIE